MLRQHARPTLLPRRAPRPHTAHVRCALAVRDPTGQVDRCPARASESGQPNHLGEFGGLPRHGLKQDPSSRIRVGRSKLSSCPRSVNVVARKARGRLNAKIRAAMDAQPTLRRGTDYGQGATLARWQNASTTSRIVLKHIHTPPTTPPEMPPTVGRPHDVKIQTLRSWRQRVHKRHVGHT